MNQNLVIRICLLALAFATIAGAIQYRLSARSLVADFSRDYLTKKVTLDVSSSTGTPVLHPIFEAKLIFVGDMMFDRHIRKMSEEKGDDFIFSCIDSELARADLVVGNLEGPITLHASVSKGSKVGSPDNYRFTFSSTTAELLARHHIQLVNLGNNHISNFGLSGIASTRAYLEQADVAYFGGLRGNAPVYRAMIGGIDLSFVNYNEFGGDTIDIVAKEIGDERALGRTVIVYAHWGEEYIEPPERVRVAARRLAEAGASLIVGSHPHVVKMHEMIGDVPVYYSLGNFIFDQYWNEEVSTGLMLLVHIMKEEGIEKINLEERLVRLYKDGRVCPV